jgi:hypothetical protein
MFSLLSKVTYDPRSGRPTPPLYWNLITFFILWGWIMSALSMFAAWLSLRDNEPFLGAAFALGGVLLPTLLHWRKRQIQREQAEFAKLVQTYERAMEQAVP